MLQNMYSRAGHEELFVPCIRLDRGFSWSDVTLYTKIKGSWSMLPCIRAGHDECYPCIRAGHDECYLVYEQVMMNVTVYTSRSWWMLPCIRAGHDECYLVYRAGSWWMLPCIRAGHDECYLVYEQVMMNVTLYTSRSWWMLPCIRAGHDECYLVYEQVMIRVTERCSIVVHQLHITHRKRFFWSIFCCKTICSRMKLSAHCTTRIYDWRCFFLYQAVCTQRTPKGPE